MLKSTLFKVIALLSLAASVHAQTKHTAIYFRNGKTYVVSSQQLLETAKKNGVRTVLDFGQPANASLVKGNELWIATDKGVKIYNLENQSIVKTEFPDTPVSGLALDAEGKIWAATTFKGVYRQQDNGQFEEKLSAMTNYCIVATADSNVYIGTNIGMYQIPLKQGAETIRYAEEAHSGHGLPDNLVENLYTDEASNVWVMMPDNVCFKKSENYFGEIPTFSFVGNKNNKIYKVIGLKQENYLFITSSGVLLLPSASLTEHSHGDEVFSGQDTNALMLTDKVISKPHNLANDPILYAEKNKDKLYFYTANGIWKIAENDIIKFLKKNSTHTAHREPKVADCQ
jgi:ligand-binding sensor domain-containing protein